MTVWFVVRVFGCEVWAFGFHTAGSEQQQWVSQTAGSFELAPEEPTEDSWDEDTEYRGFGFR